MNTENTDWGKSVTGVVLCDNKVVLARHTYGAGKGKLIIPGGYLNKGETPEEAVKREYLEEVNLVVEPKQIIGIRFNPNDWYVAFYLEYVSGDIKSDEDENSEAVWMDADEALSRDDVPGLTKALIKAARDNKQGLCDTYYDGKREDNTLYAK